MVTGMATVGVIDNFITYIAVEVSLWQFHFLRSMIAVPAIVGFGLMAGWTLRPFKAMARLGPQYVSVGCYVCLFRLFGVLSHFGRCGRSIHSAGFGDVY